MSTTVAMEATTKLLSPSVFPQPGARITISGAGYPSEKVIACLATSRHRLLMSQSAPILQAYARRHGWDLVLSSETLDDRRPPSWYKVRFIQELLERYEYVWWVDADAIIVDLDRDVLAEVDSDADIWFARHPQDRDPAVQVLNAGVFLVRSTPWARALLDEVWATEEFIDHNWWENAALLHVLGYSLEPPYEQIHRTHWNDRIGLLALDWNSVPSYCEAAEPALNHHARSDHDDFERRLEDIARDRRTVVRRYPLDFVGHWTNSTAPVSRRPHRDHEFHGLRRMAQPTNTELVDTIERLDELNEDQRLRLMQVSDWFESAVDAQVSNEFDAARCQAELVHERELSTELRSALEAACMRADAVEERLREAELRGAPPRSLRWMTNAFAHIRSRRG